MQKPHTLRHLMWRGGVAAIGNALMVTGVYPLVPHALRRDGSVRVALTEWACAALASATRPVGFLPLPSGRGPRPIIMLHGYAMNRACFYPLAHRLAAAGLGPIFGFEYWTLGRVGRAARELAAFVDEVRAATGAREVDIVGHSMGGVVARYYVSLGGGDGVVKNLVTLGSPHVGTDVSAIGIGFARRELVSGSPLMRRLSAAPPPSRTKVLAIWSRADALVPGGSQTIPGAETITYEDLGHLALLVSRRITNELQKRLG